jgi:hypothetical protein
MLLKYRVGSGACLFLVLVLLGMGLNRVMEPRYGGKGVREWIDLAVTDSASNEEAGRALEVMGVRAVPYLLERGRRPESWQRKIAAKFPSNFQELLGDARHIRSTSVYSVRMLGRLGAAEREKNAKDGTLEYPIADAVVPYLMGRLTELIPTGVNRGNMVWIDSLGDFGPRATNAIPLLQSIHSKSRDKFIRHSTVRALQKMGYWEEKFEADLPEFFVNFETRKKK